jgi:hypothetical protein
MHIMGNIEFEIPGVIAQKYPTNGVGSILPTPRVNLKPYDLDLNGATATVNSNEKR